MDNTQMTPDQVKENYGYKGKNKYINFLLNFSPRTIGVNEFNPIYEPKVSVPSIAISFLLYTYYKRRYFIIKNISLSLFSLTVNYFLYYYLIVNGIRFVDYYNQYDFNKVLI